MQYLGNLFFVYFPLINDWDRLLYILTFRTNLCPAKSGFFSYQFLWGNFAV